MTILYHSTRGLAAELDLSAVALAGLASDGGLYLPKTWPQFSEAEIAAMRGCSYREIAFRVLRPFMPASISAEILKEIMAKSYIDFNCSDVTSLKKLDSDFYILELFHGPTLAFKDIALQFLGNFFDHLLQNVNRPMTIIGATSGDTGAAAIAALANRKNINLFILYPDKGLSDIQRKQMTCVSAQNVHAMAVAGSFDDCQALVKSLFNDVKLREEWNLSTVNSINWLRILTQIVYYFVATLAVDGRPTFVVPTGNFGDIFAGYAAKKCGLPIERLVVASNRNDTLTRFFGTGHMVPESLHNTLSPSMDIQISSNFERLLFDLCDQNTAQVRNIMQDLKDKKSFSISKAQLEQAQKIFSGGCADDAQTLAAIAATYKKYNYIIDPHTAVGVKVAQTLAEELKPPIICLATAHPAKFPSTIESALGIKPPLPSQTAALISQPERITLLPAEINKIITFISEHNHDRSSHHPR